MGGGMMERLVFTAGIVLILLSTNLEVIGGAEQRLSRPGCPEKCGDITVPYPFGVGEGCYYGDDDTFSITCNQSSHPSPKPIYGDNLEVQDIHLQYAQIRISNYVSRACFNSSGGPGYNNQPWISSVKFTINTTSNTFAATGCDTIGWFLGTRSKDGMYRNYTTGCLIQCYSLDEVMNDTCSGAGCCETRIPEGLHFLSVTAGSIFNFKRTSQEFTLCSSAFVVATDSFKFTAANLTMSFDQMPKMLPVIYDWSIGNKTCADAQTDGECLCCDGHGSECHDVQVQLGGYRCSCSPGYSGNPYLDHGCQDIDECLAGNANNCKDPATCVNTPGSYYCRCPDGFQGNGTKFLPCIRKQNQTVAKIISGVSVSVIFLLLIGFLLYWHHGKKQMKKMRSTFFRQNGGLILNQKLSKRETSADLIKIFTAEDLKKATNNYSENNVVGRGGFGMVYKGTLTDDQVVAIKKSLKVDSSQIEQFINEVLVLSHVNNRNVVKLLGCCLETEVPLLVYEFVRNGTLHDHLHDESKASVLSWDIRLRVAMEVAEVLAYLHTTVSTPIIHRDIKSMNILLDENFIAKVADFGASRLVPMDQDQLATMVLGTHGYLDPEYMQTSELNEKSDVYSFGVVLAELLTRRKALSFDRPENERCLAMHFLTKLKEQRVLEIVDEKIRTHGVFEQLMEVAILARKCLELKGEDRPDMKEVAMELQGIRRKEVRSWSLNVELSEEEMQHSDLLSKTPEHSGAYHQKFTLDSSESHSSSMQLLPSGHGR